MFVRFIDTCAMPYSFTNQPIPFTCFNIPGMRTGSPFASSTGFPDGVPSLVFALPCSRTSNATEFARRTDFGSAGFLVEHRWPEIWFPLRLFYLLEKSFVFPCANHSKIRSGPISGRSFVQIHRDS